MAGDFDAFEHVGMKVTDKRFVQGTLEGALVMVLKERQRAMGLPRIDVLPKLGTIELEWVYWVGVKEILIR